MQLIGIPADGQLHMHKSTCRDIGTYRGTTYDDCEHITAANKDEASTRLPQPWPLNWFPCTRALAAR